MGRDSDLLIQIHYEGHSKGYRLRYIRSGKFPHELSPEKTLFARDRDAIEKQIRTANKNSK